MNRSNGRSFSRGFTLVEVMVVMAILGVLAAIALPNYRNYVVRAARTEAQTELLELAGLQEKIFLNSNNYAFSVTAAYNGTAAGGLGRTSGRTKDERYNLSMVDGCTTLVAMTAVGQTFGLLATPVAGGTQAADGTLCVSESGRRVWAAPSGTVSW